MIALVTGASSGIGKDISKELAKRNYNLIIVSRDPEKLEKAKEEIQKEYKIEIDVIPVDLSNEEECIKLYEKVHEKYGAIDVLINNAGFGDCGEFVDTSLEKEMKMIKTNITAYHILTKLFMQDMVKQNKGHIMNVASIAGFMPGPLMSTYYATKAYVVRLTQAIRQELYMKKSKVKITALCPGPVKTNFDKVANVNFSFKQADSSKVARYAVKKMFKNKILIFPQIPIKMAHFFSKIVPDPILAFFVYFVQKNKIEK